MLHRQFLPPEKQGYHCCHTDSNAGLSPAVRPAKRLQCRTCYDGALAKILPVAMEVYGGFPEAEFVGAIGVVDALLLVVLATNSGVSSSLLHSGWRKRRRYCKSFERHTTSSIWNMSDPLPSPIPALVDPPFQSLFAPLPMIYCIERSDPRDPEES